MLGFALLFWLAPHWVVLLFLDPQVSASNWSDLREADDPPVIAPPGLTHTMVDVTGLDCHPGDRAVIPHDLVLTSEHVLRRYTEE